ncbi:MAG: hypothetical protein PW843_09745 [Azospirillaceae bacterium]|nr:hypothetical protein [Azospirillaceae bacterium]
MSKGLEFTSGTHAGDPAQMLTALGLPVTESGIRFLRTLADRGRDHAPQSAPEDLPIPFPWY